MSIASAIQFGNTTKAPATTSTLELGRASNKFVLDVLGRTAIAQCAQLDTDGRINLVRSIGTPWDGSTAWTSWTSGKRDTTGGVLTEGPWSEFGRMMIRALAARRAEGRGSLVLACSLEEWRLL